MSNKYKTDEEFAEEMTRRLVVRWAIFVGEVIGLIFGVWVASWTGAALIAAFWLLLAVLWTGGDILTIKHRR